MHVVCVCCSWKNSDKETTSLELPSLPAPDGFQNPVQSPGLNSKICNPTNQLLDRSVSAPASICSSQSSLAEPIDPRARESSASAARCQTTPEEQHPPLLLQHLATNASLADNDPSPQAGEVTCGSPACPSEKPLAAAGIADSQWEHGAEEQGPGQEHPLEVTKENSLADAAVKHRHNEDGCLSLEQKELPKEPEKKEHLEGQTETTHPEPRCPVEKPGVGEARQAENPPVETRGDGQEEAGLSGAKGSVQVSASCSCVQAEAFMEIDVAEQSVAEEHIPGSEQAESRSGAELGSDPVSMEVEPLKSASSSSGTPAKSKELSALAAADSSCPSSIHQLDPDPGRPAEESCSSLASALKELHKLLVVSRKGECKILASEEVSRLEVVHSQPAAQQKGFSEGEQKGSDPASQEQSCSLCEARSEGGRAEGKQLCDAGTGNSESVSRMQPAPGAGAAEVLRCSGKGDSVLVNSAATSGQQQSSEQSEISAEGSQSPTNPTWERKASVCPTPAPAEGAAAAAQSPFAAAPGSSSSPASEGPQPLAGCEEPLLSPGGGSAGPGSGAAPPAAFPAAAVGRLLGAGFSTREALEALERADGNADLALLILLAKGIVVPSQLGRR
ncbi:regulatory solute carrier protein family 1 member 1 [Dryobates pubescens]|uniref:regulatory solute carrier protein family 1 member 1 n=1 Tax=Dryobates pubescens TaxID=118200 RepID=UPI0023B963AE|nr:regulatory solute carrier protein family 1 member 1 [Dryobates pubescens]